MVGPLSVLILWQAVVVMATDLLPGSLSNSMEGDLTLLPKVVGNYLLKKISSAYWEHFNGPGSILWGAL